MHSADAAPESSQRLEALCPAGAGVGIARVVFPDTVVPGFAVASLSSNGRLVVRVLGARQITQTVVTSRNLTPAVLLLGAVVDVAHAAA